MKISTRNKVHTQAKHLYNLKERKPEDGLLTLKPLNWTVVIIDVRCTILDNNISVYQIIYGAFIFVLHCEHGICLSIPL